MVTLQRVFGRRASSGKGDASSKSVAAQEAKRGRNRLSLFVLGNASKATLQTAEVAAGEKSPTTSNSSASSSAASARSPSSSTWEHRPSGAAYSTAGDVTEKRSVSSMTDYAKHADDHSQSAALSMRTPSMTDSLYGGLPPPPPVAGHGSSSQRPQMRRFGTSGSTQYESLEEVSDEEEEQTHARAIAELIREGRLCRERQVKRLAERASKPVDISGGLSSSAPRDAAGNRVSIYNRMSKHYGSCPASSLP